MQVKVLERDFSRKPCECYDECDHYDEDDCTCECDCIPEDIKVIVGEDDRTSGFLPFYSVDTEEEVHALVQLALEAGEFVEQHGRIYETTLLQDQTLDNLSLAGERLKALHEQWKESSGRG